MSKIGGSKRELFIDKMTSEQPVMLSKLLTSPSGTTFLNYSTIIRDVPAHSIKFKFSQTLKPNIAKIALLLNEKSSGFVKLEEELHLANSTGTINLSIWKQHIPQLIDGNFYTISQKWICCPKIPSILPMIYSMCNTNQCGRKVVIN
ncbi:unnamed protein product, partial [Pocillopora meandrina]